MLALGPILFFSFWGSVLGVGGYYATYYALSLLSSGIGSAQNLGVAPRGPLTNLAKEGFSETARGLQGTKEMLVS
jgi:hypothetical protein